MFEINLVPDAKAEMVEAQKSRNLIVFICSVVCVVSIAIVLLAVLFRTTQEVTMSNQDGRLEMLSNKMHEYSGLDEVLTIRNQLNTVDVLKGDRNVLSRVFMLLQSLMPSGSDTVTISEMEVDLEDYTLRLEGQAVAGGDTDGINSRVLEAFQKQVGMMKYDYGRYVTSSGAEIPTWCIAEANDMGIPYEESGGVLYAMWRRGVKGCDPDRDGNDGSKYSDETTVVSLDDEEMEQEEVEQAVDAALGEQVKIYRTPQFEQWEKEKYLNSDGEISGVPHFESQCNQYTKGNDGKWSVLNECMLTEGAMELTDAPTNGRQETGGLVLRFTGEIIFNPEVFSYQNKHLVAIAPSGRANVTDSFVQVEQIFGEKALDCAKGDAECKSAK